jgi:hypothetical protein
MFGAIRRAAHEERWCFDVPARRAGKSSPDRADNRLGCAAGAWTESIVRANLSQLQGVSA